ncbi:MAG: hypothetical protein WAO52_02820 [Prolixibacteraceae bacterium]
MENQEPTDEQINREFKMMYIDTFSETYENVIDTTLEDVIATKISSSAKSKFKAKKSTNHFLSDSDEALEIEMDSYYEQLNQSNTRNITFAIYELRIIYAYKYFEIRLKELAMASFDNWPDDEVFKWDDILKFFLGKGINLKALENYQLVYDLGRVNNSIKHKGNKIGKKIRNIPEFRGSSHLEYGHLEAFYNRVKAAPNAFIKELASVIYDDLFKDEKTTNIESEFDIPEGGLEIDWQ